MNGFFDYPKAAAFGRVIPKNKIYEHAGASTKLKDLFVAEVDQIVWRYKLAPETLNLASTKAVPEIQVFDIVLRTRDMSPEIVQAIDGAIPFPILFELVQDGRRRVLAAYKRPSANGWTASGYFGTDWAKEGAKRSALPVALDLGGLYEAILLTLMPAEVRTGEEAMELRVARLEAVRAQEKEVARIARRLAREKQFNRRVAINAELRAAKAELARLTRPVMVGQLANERG